MSERTKGIFEQLREVFCWGVLQYFLVAIVLVVITANVMAFIRLAEVNERHSRIEQIEVPSAGTSAEELEWARAEYETYCATTEDPLECLGF